ncbi:tRNA(Ile)-lysidine synthetase [Thiovulum sp. ES]|nr:tRNA(Ile)-lysidine synthetase [Thiovulum sp. ES]
MDFIAPETVSLLKKGKNLLAFSGGVDSSALFFILMKYEIDFDIAIVDYQIRPQSSDEVDYAKYLAQQYEKMLFIGAVSLDKFSEGEARTVRYKFFSDIIEQNSYRNLITAHQLNDKLEWFFMQFSKGAGLLEISGMGEFESRENYRIVRPLIEISKDQILSYLEENNIKYFVDASNFDEQYRRNYFRHNFSNKFLQNFEEGVRKSFQYLETDRTLILNENIEIFREEKLSYFESSQHDRVTLFYVDKILKKEGYLLSAKQRDEIMFDREVVIGSEWVIAITPFQTYICPHSQTSMPKEFKERCRVRRIPNLIRPYLFDIGSSIC